MDNTYLSISSQTSGIKEYFGSTLIFGLFLMRFILSAYLQKKKKIVFSMSNFDIGQWHTTQNAIFYIAG